MLNVPSPFRHSLYSLPRSEASFVALALKIENNITSRIRSSLLTSRRPVNVEDLDATWIGTSKPSPRVESRFPLLSLPCWCKPQDWIQTLLNKVTFIGNKAFTLRCSTPSNDLYDPRISGLAVLSTDLYGPSGNCSKKPLCSVVWLPSILVSWFVPLRFSGEFLVLTTVRVC